MKSCEVCVAIKKAGVGHFSVHKFSIAKIYSRENLAILGEYYLLLQKTETPEVVCVFHKAEAAAVEIRLKKMFRLFRSQLGRDQIMDFSPFISAPTLPIVVPFGGDALRQEVDWSKHSKSPKWLAIGTHHR